MTDDVGRRIFAASRELFVARGYKQTSILEIVHRANIAIGSFYHHYASKEQLFADIYFAENEESKSRIVAAVDWSKPRAAFKQVITLNLQQLRENQILAAWYSKDLGKLLRAQYRARTQEGDRLGLEILNNIKDWEQNNLIANDISTQQALALIALVDRIDIELAPGDEAVRILVDGLLLRLFPELDNTIS